MELIQPSIGLIFWTCIVFFISIFILKKFAWKPILSAIDKREEFIKKAMDSAKKAKEDAELINKNHDKAIKEALAQKESLISEAKQMKEKILEQAKQQAKQEADKILQEAHNTINIEREQMLLDMKKYLVDISVVMTEKILKEKLDKTKKQEDFINTILEEINL